MVTEKSFTLVCIEFCPKQAKSYNVVAQCQLNYSTSNVKKFQFIGECFKPGVELGSEGKLYYPPTYMGVSTREKIILYNKTLIPLDVCVRYIIYIYIYIYSAMCQRNTKAR